MKHVIVLALAITTFSCKDQLVVDVYPLSANRQVNIENVSVEQDINQYKQLSISISDFFQDVSVWHLTSPFVGQLIIFSQNIGYFCTWEQQDPVRGFVTIDTEVVKQRGSYIEETVVVARFYDETASYKFVIDPRIINGKKQFDLIPFNKYISTINVNANPSLTNQVNNSHLFNNFPFVANPVAIRGDEWKSEIRSHQTVNADGEYATKTVNCEIPFNSVALNSPIDSNIVTWTPSLALSFNITNVQQSEIFDTNGDVISSGLWTYSDQSRFQSFADIFGSTYEAVIETKTALKPFRKYKIKNYVNSVKYVYDGNPIDKDVSTVDFVDINIGSNIPIDYFAVEFETSQGFYEGSINSALYNTFIAPVEHNIYSNGYLVSLDHKNIEVIDVVQETKQLDSIVAIADGKTFYISDDKLFYLDQQVIAFSNEYGRYVIKEGTEFVVRDYNHNIIDVIDQAIVSIDSIITAVQQNTVYQFSSETGEYINSYSLAGEIIATYGENFIIKDETSIAVVINKEIHKANLICDNIITQTIDHQYAYVFVQCDQQKVGYFFSENETKMFQLERSFHEIQHVSLIDGLLYIVFKGHVNNSFAMETRLATFYRDKQNINMMIFSKLYDTIIVSRSHIYGINKLSRSLFEAATYSLHQD